MTSLVATSSLRGRTRLGRALGLSRPLRLVRSTPCCPNCRPGRSPASSATATPAAIATWMQARIRRSAACGSSHISRPSPKRAQEAAGWALCGRSVWRPKVAMLAATNGINTHRGAIFASACSALRPELGQPVACAPARRSAPIVTRLWGHAIASGTVPPRTAMGRTLDGGMAPAGARLEAAQGFPSVFAVALPALRRGDAMAPGDREAARVQALFRPDRVARGHQPSCTAGDARGSASRRSRQLVSWRRGGVGGANWRAAAEAVHRAFVARRLSPGGSADLLGDGALRRGGGRRVRGPCDAERFVTLAVLCSGQGLQHSRMFALTADPRLRQPTCSIDAAKLLGGARPA